MGPAESWLMLTPLDVVREGTHTLMMMKPGLSAKEVNIFYIQLKLPCQLGKKCGSSVQRMREN